MLNRSEGVVARRSKWVDKMRKAQKDVHHAPRNTHLHPIKKEHPAKCVCCPDSDETIEHFLFHCSLYDDIRTRLLPAQTKYTQHAIWIHYTTATNSHLQHVSYEQTRQDCPNPGGPRKVKGKKKDVAEQYQGLDAGRLTSDVQPKLN